MRSTVSNTGASIFLLLAVGIVLIGISTTNAAPHPASYPGYYSPMYLESQNPEYLLETIARLREALTRDNDLENEMVNIRQAPKYSERHVSNIGQDADNNNDEIDYAVVPVEGIRNQHFQKRLTPDFGLGRGHTGEMENKIELLKMLG